MPKTPQEIFGPKKAYLRDSINQLRDNGGY